MNINKEKAIELRKQGLSYIMIREKLGIPMSTLAYWLKNEPWSLEIKARLSSQASWANPRTLELLAQANRKRWEGKHEEYKVAAIREFKKYKSDPLFLAGIMLYWGEGEKQQKSSQVRLSNSEPEMIKIFNLFLLKVLRISPDKISARLLLYPDLIESVQKNFWSKATGIPLSSFKKSIRIKGHHHAKRLSYGVCTIYINSRALKERILMWLNLYPTYLQSHSSSLEE